MIHRYHILIVIYLFVAVICSSSNYCLSFATTHATSSTSSSNTKHATETSSTPSPPTESSSVPIVYTIAGSDSGGGAGIQADLHAIHAMNCHGCSAITCLTAQNSISVTSVHTPPSTFLKQQLETLATDLKPQAIKIGMLGTKELCQVVGQFIKTLLNDSNQKIWIVVDPVMISTSGSKLLDDDAIDAMIQYIFPVADIITPNKFEAEALLHRKLTTPTDVEKGARELLKLGCRSVLIKGGHTLLENSSPSSDETSQQSSSLSSEVQSTLEYAQDYLLSSDPSQPPGKERFCDASKGVWLRSPRWNSHNTHGTGCTLSSAIASALALGEENRQNSNTQKVGAITSIDIVDACCLAKAYVSAGIQKGIQLGSGPGPVAQTQFPSSCENFPSIVPDATTITSFPSGFRKMKAFSSRKENNNNDVDVLGRILPIVDTEEWVERLSQTPGITDIQLRVKDETDRTKMIECVKTCQNYCQTNGVRLWINDHWEAAIEAGCYGVHVGQEDLVTCTNKGGLEKIRSNGMALGISTHSFGELAVALGIQPSYISMGPIYATSSKNVQFDPQGLDTVKRWRQLISPSVPFVTIGGINDVASAKSNKSSGADSIAVIGAITKSDNVQQSVKELNNAMDAKL